MVAAPRAAIFAPYMIFGLYADTIISFLILKVFAIHTLLWMGWDQYTDYFNNEIAPVLSEVFNALPNMNPYVKQLLQHIISKFI